MMVLAGTLNVFSPSLYFSTSVLPSELATSLSTLALVMVLLGTRSHGPWPSPVPRMASGKMWISTAFWVPSGCGMAVMPTKEPCLTSAIVPLTTASTTALSATLTCNLVPSRDVTFSIWPSTLSMVPRTRTTSGDCASAAVIAIAAPMAKAALNTLCFISRSLRWLDASAPHADIAVSHVRCFQRSVVELLCRGDEDFLAGLEFARRRLLEGDDDGCRRHQDLLVAVFVLDRDRLTVGAGDLFGHRGIGHRRIGLEIPGPVAFGDTAHRLGEDQDRHRLLAAVGLRHGGHGRVGVLLDVGKRGLHHLVHRRIIGELDFHRGAVARLRRQHLAVNGLEGGAHAHRLRRLGRGKGSCEKQCNGASAQRPACHRRHRDPPKGLPVHATS